MATNPGERIAADIAWMEARAKATVEREQERTEHILKARAGMHAANNHEMCDPFSDAGHFYALPNMHPYSEAVQADKRLQDCLDGVSGLVFAGDPCYHVRMAITKEFTEAELA